MASPGSADDGLATPNCPICLRPLEAVEASAVALWDCGYCNLDEL